MRNILFTLIILAAITACSKQVDKEEKPEYEGINGDWVLIERRADPGDGSGTWQKDTVRAALSFLPDGGYRDTRSSQFNRYTYKGDTITLFSTAHTETYKLSVQELNKTTLSYYFNGWWCGGPSGEKWTRISSFLCDIKY